MLWRDITNKSERLGISIDQVLREEIHKAILVSLSHVGAFNYMVFQGGTALRLFYRNPRFSEDLDFVLRKNKDFDITRNISDIQRFVKYEFPFINKVTIRTRREDKVLQRVILKISGQTFQEFRIHVELARVPSYRNRPRILEYHPFNPVVRVEEPDEILADKVVALGNRPYLKGRDVWDIYFLIEEKKLTIPWDMVLKKAKDYGTTPSNLRKGISECIERLKEDGLKILNNELLRFLPKRSFDQYQEMFDEIVSTVIENVRGGYLEE